jgi:TonB family protein
VAHQALEAIDLNGEAGNKNTPAGVDAVKEPDFGPYMQDLQKRIKQVWHPPRGNESKRVVVIFRVDRLGRLIRVEVTKSSGAPLADRAAVAAIEQIFPFRPLPAEFADENIDIEFTFDYNVFNDKRRSRRS